MAKDGPKEITLVGLMDGQLKANVSFQNGCEIYIETISVRYIRFYEKCNLKQESQLELRSKNGEKSWICYVKATGLKFPSVLHG